MKVTHRSKLYRNGTDELKQIITAMAFPRDIWITKFRQRFEGTLKEYTKIHLVEKLELKNYWNKEVTVLAKRVVSLLDPKITKCKGNWNIYKAAAEGFLEASGEQVKCKEALNDFKNYEAFTPTDIKRIYKYWAENVPDSVELSFEILNKYFPKEHRDGIAKELQKIINF